MTADFASKIFGLNISKQEILQHLVKELDAVLPPDTLDKKGN
jgi:hypothetical protein